MVLSLNYSKDLTKHVTNGFQILNNEKASNLGLTYSPIQYKVIFILVPCKNIKTKEELC